MTAAPRLSVDRLTLDVGPMSEADARRLAVLVGEALRRWPAAPAAPGRIERVAATVEGAAGERVEQLAERIARAVLTAALRELRA